MIRRLAFWRRRPPVINVTVNANGTVDPAKMRAAVEQAIRAHGRRGL